MTARLYRLAAALLPWLALLGCTRTVREQSAVREVVAVHASASSTAAVDTRETRGPVVTVVEEWGNLPAIPDGSGVGVVAEGGASLPRQVPDAPGANASSLTSAKPVLLRRTTITQGPSVLDTHATAATATQAHAAAQRDATATTQTETRAGPPWWLYVGALLVAGVVAYLLGRRFTG